MGKMEKGMEMFMNPEERAIPQKMKNNLWMMPKDRRTNGSDSSEDEVVRLVRAIRKWWIKFDKLNESQFHLLWTYDFNAADNRRHGLNYITAAKPKLQGLTEGIVRVWEVETGRCLKVWDVGESVQHVAWNPSQERPILAAALCGSTYEDQGTPAYRGI